MKYQSFINAMKKMLHIFLGLNYQDWWIHVKFMSAINKLEDVENV